MPSSTAIPVAVSRRLSSNCGSGEGRAPGPVIRAHAWACRKSRSHKPFVLCCRLFERSKSRSSHKLSNAEQGAPVTAVASLALADKTSVQAASVELLAFRVVGTFMKIQPNNGIRRAVALRLALIPERRQWHCIRIECADYGDRHRGEADGPPRPTRQGRPQVAGSPDCLIQIKANLHTID